jgi:AraC-like DNA-binding protein
MPGPIQEIQLAAAPGAWMFVRADPDEDLRGLVVEYWEVEGALSAFRETLLPNGAVEVMINLGPPHRLVSDAGDSVWTHGWFSGLHERALVIESLEGTHLLSARLTPLGAVALLGRRAPDAANRVVDLDAFLGDDGPHLRARATAASTPAERFAVLEAVLRELRATGEPAPDFVRAAVERIDAAHGNLRVASLHESLGYSRKHLATSFDRAIGVSMKAYAQIRRFVWTLGQLQQSTSVSWSTLASDAGYSDQSHLVRDFRRVGAASPTDYLKRITPDGTALLYEPGSEER